jgi:alcohol dehydrogenase (NADP+)
MDKYKSSLDFIIDTIPFDHNIDIYMDLLKTHGSLCIVGSFFPMKSDFNCTLRKGRKIIGSNTGGISDCQEVLDFCNNHAIYPEVELIDMRSINETHEKIKNSQVKYRYVIDMSTLYNHMF